MKLGISRPRNQEYRPRPIDQAATKRARTRHANGVKRLGALLGGTVAVPAPGTRPGNRRRRGRYSVGLRPPKAVRRAKGKAARAARRANR